jgi:putative membrane protein
VRAVGREAIVMIHRGFAFGAGGGLLMIALLMVALLGLALLVVLVVAPRRPAAPAPPVPMVGAPGSIGPQYPPPHPALSPARAILDERLARGEIQVEEYQRLRAALEGPGA